MTLGTKALVRPDVQWRAVGHPTYHHTVQKVLTSRRTGVMFIIANCDESRGDMNQAG